MLPGARPLTDLRAQDSLESEGWSEATETNARRHPVGPNSCWHAPEYVRVLYPGAHAEWVTFGSDRLAYVEGGNCPPKSCCEIHSRGAVYRAILWSPPLPLNPPPVCPFLTVFRDPGCIRVNVEWWQTEAQRRRGVFIPCLFVCAGDGSYTVAAGGRLEKVMQQIKSSGAGPRAGIQLGPTPAGTLGALWGSYTRVISRSGYRCRLGWIVLACLTIKGHLSPTFMSWPATSFLCREIF